MLTTIASGSIVPVIKYWALHCMSYDCMFQVKVIVVDNELTVVYQDGVKFDTDLSEFK